MFISSITLHLKTWAAERSDYTMVLEGRALFTHNGCPPQLHCQSERSGAHVSKYGLSYSNMKEMSGMMLFIFNYPIIQHLLLFIIIISSTYFDYLTH